MLIPISLIYYKDKHEDFKKLYADHNPEHNYINHTLLVAQYCQELCRANYIPYTREIELAAILHDLGDKYDRKNHAEVSIALLDDVLAKLDIDTSELDMELLKDCILHHRASYTGPLKTDAEKVVSAADRMKPCVTKEALLNNVYLRAVIYNMTHPEEPGSEDPVACAFDWIYDTYVVKEDGRYPEIYKRTWGEDLKVQQDLIRNMTLPEVRKYCDDKGLFQPITEIR